MEIIYYYAKEEDALGINYVSAYSWKETYSDLLPKEYLDQRINTYKDRTERTKTFLKNYNGKYYVAKDSDKVVGILAFQDSKEDKYRDYGHIEALYVLKEYQGQGIGKRLFEIAVSELKNMGYQKVELECMSGNDTINFYKKYTGNISSQIDYQIPGVGTVKADIVLFENIDEILELLNKKRVK